MERKYILAVKPLEPYILQIDFISGSRLLLDMKPYVDKIRFRTLTDPKVWNSAVTNGIFVRFGDVELSHDEILSMAERLQLWRQQVRIRSIITLIHLRRALHMRRQMILRV